jgi:eukaryotic-like serine/threonine-protein kinase
MSDISNDYIISFLQKTQGFSTMPREDLEQLAKLFTHKSFCAGEFMIHQGEIGRSMYLLLEGSVDVIISGQTDDVNYAKIVSNLQKGAVMGEMALLTKEPRNADIVASTDIEVLELNGDDLTPLLHAYPHLAQFLTAIMEKRIREDGFSVEVGKYRILEQIGKGQTATVFAGIHPGLNRKVAVKMLHHFLALDQLFIKRFVDEAKIVALLDHQNIVRVYDQVDLFGTFFIVMENVSGTDLKMLLSEKKKLPQHEVISILRQLIIAIQYAHKQGVIHRDIKPANCAITNDGTVKIMDFGISRLVRDIDNNKDVIIGSPKYLAPEVIRGSIGDERSDIYAIGVMAYELLTGHPPFTGKTVRDILSRHLREEPPDITEKVAGLPKGLVAFINSALQKRPTEREVDPVKILQFFDRRTNASKQVSGQCSIPEFLRIDGSQSALKEVEDVVKKYCNKKGINIRCAKELSYSNRRSGF